MEVDRMPNWPCNYASQNPIELCSLYLKKKCRIGKYLVIGLWNKNPILLLSWNYYFKSLFLPPDEWGFPLFFFFFFSSVKVKWRFAWTREQMFAGSMIVPCKARMKKKKKTNSLNTATLTKQSYEICRWLLSPRVSLSYFLTCCWRRIQKWGL